MDSTGVIHATGGTQLQVGWPVVVLNTHHSGLAIARDLAPFGVRVVGVTAEPAFPGNQSKWLDYRPAPDSLKQPEALLEFLLQLGGELGTCGLLLPTRDHDINFLGRYRDRLEERFILPMLPAAAIDKVMNKNALAVFAQRVGLGFPRTVTITRPAELDGARSLRFPCICKPLYASQWRQPVIWEAVGRQKALRVETFDELESFYRAFAHIDPLVTVQEWIEGGESNLQVFGSYCKSDGDVVAFFTARKKLQYPPLAGTGIVVEGLVIPELEAPSRALLRALQFRGISEIEYKRDDRDGRLYLIEVNPRHWDQHGLGTAVGVNLSEALYRDATGQPPRAMQQSAERKLWIGEAEYARHLARCLVGRAPWRDATLAFGASRTWAVFSRADAQPFFALMGMKSNRAKA